MERSKEPFIVPGEASESDEGEEFQASNENFQPNTSSEKVEEVVIAGEASESDCDSDCDDTYNITSEAFASRMQKAEQKLNTSKSNQKYNSLLHRKLRESNWKLKQHLKEFTRHHLEFVCGEVNTVNKELLETQVLLHEAAAALRQNASGVLRLNNLMVSITSHRNDSLVRLNVPKQPALGATFQVNAASNVN